MAKRQVLMYYNPSPFSFLLNLTRRLAICFQVYPKSMLEAVEEKKEKDFLERECFYPSVERKQP